MSERGRYDKRSVHKLWLLGCRAGCSFCAYVCSRVHACIRMHMHVCAHVCIVFTCACVYVCARVYVCAHACVYMCMYSVCTCARVHMCVCVHLDYIKILHIHVHGCQHCAFFSDLEMGHQSHNKVAMPSSQLLSITINVGKGLVKLIMCSDRHVDPTSGEYPGLWHIVHTQDQ